MLIQYCPLSARDMAVLVPPGSHLHLNTRHRDKGQRGAGAAASHMQVGWRGWVDRGGEALWVEERPSSWVGIKSFK